MTAFSDELADIAAEEGGEGRCEGTGRRHVWAPARRLRGGTIQVRECEECPIEVYSEDLAPAAIARALEPGPEE